MCDQKAVDSFLESITLLDAGNGIKRETALYEGRQNLAVVLAALEQGHRCLQSQVMVGEGPRIFLQLVSEAMGMSQFLRADLKTVRPVILSCYVDGLLYPSDPPESEISDDDLRFIMERFGKANPMLRARVMKVIANRKDARAGVE